MNYLLILLWSATTVSLQHHKAVPYEINYQGWLGAIIIDTVIDTVGVTDTLDMVFKLYNTPTGGTSLWDEFQNDVQVDKGIFNVLLGSVSPIPESLFTGDPLWLEIQVGVETLSPRKKLVSVGYAIKSEFADHATYADTAITHITEFDTVVFVYNADSLNHLHSSQFLRSDTDDTAKGKYLFTKTGDVEYTMKVEKVDYSTIPGRKGLSVEVEHQGPAWGCALQATATITGEGQGTGIVGYAHGNNSETLKGGHFSAIQKGSGDVQALHCCVDTGGTGTHFGGYFWTRGKGPVYGINNDVSASSDDTHNVYGIYTTVAELGTGKHYGGYFSAESNVADEGKTYGVFSSASNKGSGDAVGGLFQAGSAGTGPHTGVSGAAYGVDSGCKGVCGYASATGDGSATGGFFEAGEAGTGIHYGSYSVSDSIAVYGYTTSPNRNYAGYFNGNVYINDILQIKPRSDFPSPPSAGMLIFNSDSSALFYYNGSKWKKL